MNFAIYFHYQTSGVTVKIHNETVNYLLAAKVKALKPIATELLPEDSFLFGHLPTKLFGPLYFGLVYLLSNDNVASRQSISSLTSPLAPPRNGEGNMFSLPSQGRGLGG